MRILEVLRRPRKGQAMIVIALAMVGLVSLVALAVDGGNAYAQRRSAQNAADAAALAGAQKMLQLWAAAGYPAQLSGSAELEVQTVIVDALRNSSVQYEYGEYDAWFINRDGERWGSSPIGYNGGFNVWYGNINNEQAIGVFIRANSRSETYFARVLGINEVAASAESEFVFGGISSINGNPAAQPKVAGLMPVIVSRDDVQKSLMSNGELTLICHGSGKKRDDGTEIDPCPKGVHPWSPGNWGWLDFDGDENRMGDLLQWIDNGFDPATGIRVNRGGSWSTETDLQANDRVYGTTGWRTPACQALASRIGDPYREIVMFPVTDQPASGTGANTNFNIVNFVVVELTSYSCTSNSDSMYVKGRVLNESVSVATATGGSPISSIAQYGTGVVSNFSR